MSPLLAVIRHGVRSWWKDKRSLILGIVTPVLLFLTFSFIFSDRKAPLALDLAWIDLDQSDISIRLREILQSEGMIKPFTALQGPLDTQKIFLNETNLQTLMTSGKISLAVLILPGLEDQVTKFKGWKETFVKIYYDPTERVRGNMLKGLLAKAGFLLTSEVWAKSKNLEDLSHSENLDPKWLNFAKDLSRAFKESRQFMQERNRDSISESFIPLSVEEVKTNQKTNLTAAQQLAGIAVMFLLFSVARAGTILLEEKQSGTLKRILSSPVSIYQLVLGKIFSLTANGFIQITILCLVGWLFFHLPIFNAPIPLFMLIILTAFCAATFGLLFAAFCQTSEQVQYCAVLIILGMSILGGSIVPKFALPPWAQKLSYFTINSWATDGFLNLLIRGGGFSAIWTQLGMLSLMSLLFITVSFWLLPRRLYE